HHPAPVKTLRHVRATIQRRSKRLRYVRVALPAPVKTFTALPCCPARIGSFICDTSVLTGHNRVIRLSHFRAAWTTPGHSSIALPRCLDITGSFVYRTSVPLFGRFATSAVLPPGVSPVPSAVSVSGSFNCSANRSLIYCCNLSESTTI